MIKKKELSVYLETIVSLGNKRDYLKAKQHGLAALRQLEWLAYNPHELFDFYRQMGDTCSNLHEYSFSIDYYYKAYLLGLKERFKPADIAYLSVGMAGGFIMTQHIDQAMGQLDKIRTYYQTYGDQIEPMNKQQYFFFLINLAYCYLHKKQMDKAWEIIDRQLGVRESELAEYKLCHMDYYHLKGEYLVERGEYAQAQQSFEESIRISRTAKFLVGELESRLHLAILLLLDKKIDDSIEMLLTIYDEAGKLKDSGLMCETGLLLSKCYSLRSGGCSQSPQSSLRSGGGSRSLRSSLQKDTDKPADIERRIKPLLKHLDITWFYEKTREFDELYKLLQPIYKSSRYTPLILIDGVDRHYRKAAYKDILIGKSPAMQKVYQLIEKIAGTDLPVLVQGETGTGKELICRFLHQHSQRAEKPYLTLDCGALPENLLENELFGHSTGAYTGATEDKKGYVELASGGTLMLDEITNMSAGMQRKLLRVLEEKQIWPLGAEKSVPVDTRFVFASNQDVEQMMAKGILRSDLFYRINAVVVNLPPLKERPEDIPLLIEHFIGKYAAGIRNAELGVGNEKFRTPQSTFRISDAALRILAEYSWPGNVRELENEIQKICILHRDEKIVTEDMLSEPIRIYIGGHGRLVQVGGRAFGSVPSDSLSRIQKKGKTLIQLRDEFERQVIRDAIKEHDGNVAEASRQLGYDRTSLYKKMKQLGIK